MSKRDPLKHGDSVRVYEATGIWDGVVQGIRIDRRPSVVVKFEDGPNSFIREVFAQQVRRLRKKPSPPAKGERVERWVNVYKGEHVGKMGMCCYATQQECLDGAIHSKPRRSVRLVELRSGEIILDREKLAKAWEAAVNVQIGDNRSVVDCLWDEFNQGSAK